MFALSEHKRGDNPQGVAVLADNLLNGISEDKENGTAHWGKSDLYYRWSDGGIESTAFTIKALSNIKPDSAVLDPAVKWMSLNRRGARWSNTRDTAIAILGLADYLKASKELAPDYSYQVLVNGEAVREGTIDPSNVFTFGRTIDIPADKLKDGKNTVKIVMNGKGALYASAYTKFFTLEEPVTKAGNEVFVERRYFVQSVKETLMKGLAQDWKPLKDGEMPEDLAKGLRGERADRAAYFACMRHILDAWHGRDGRLGVLLGVDGVQRCSDELLRETAEYDSSRAPDCHW